MHAASLPLKRVLVGMLFVISSSLLAGCSSSQPALAPIRIASRGWESIASPVPDLGNLAYTVSPTNPSILYACSADKAGSGTMLLWRTEDAGRHWSRLSRLPTPGNGCQIDIDPVQSQLMAIAVVNLDLGQRPCDDQTFYLSSDGGESWQHIPHVSTAPVGAISAFCTIQVAGSHLYICNSYVQGQRQLGILERSDDRGASWTRIDRAFSRGSLFLQPRIGMGGTVLAINVMHWSPSGTLNTAPFLWMSHNAGQTWQLMGQVPGDTAIFTSYQQNEAASSLAPFYNLSEEQAPEALYLLHIYQSNDGHTWSTLPPLPAPDTSAKHPGLLQALAVTGDGRLLAFGVDPKAGLQPGNPGDEAGSTITTFWLWIWNPALARWQVLSVPLAHSEQAGCGLCWSASLSTGADHVTYLYVAHAGSIDNSDNAYAVFRVRVPGA